MKKLILTIILSLFLNAQFNQFASSGSPFFKLNYNLEYVDSLDNPVLNIITDIKYDHLSFNKFSKASYQSKYLLKIFVKNTKTEEIYDKYDRQIEITVDEYNKTNSRKLSSKVTHSMELIEGNFIILASLYDYHTTKIFHVNKKVNTKSSNLKRMMVNNFKIWSNDSIGDDMKISYERNFPKLNGEIKFEFVINKIQPEMVGKKVNINFTIRNELLKNALVKDSTLLINSRDFKKLEYKFKKSELNGIAFDYLVKIKFKDDVLDEEKGTFSYTWNIHPNNKEQMAVALEQMRYIMDEDTVVKYKEEPIEVSIEKFKFFWKSLSVSGSDLEAANLTREYFKRVLKANRLFKKFTYPGWKTDMGRIFIKFGEPDETYAFQRTESQYSQPRKYIAWRFYNERKTFYFYDFDGFDDYRLTDESRMAEYQ